MTAGRDEFTYTRPISGIPFGDAPNILARSFSITAKVEVPKEGIEGMLNTIGGRFGGYGLYVLKGKPVFTYNLCDFARFRWEGKDALTPGKHTITFDVTYDGPGPAKGGTGELKVDGNSVDFKKIPHTALLAFTVDESFDVGSDSGSPVDGKDYQCPFCFTGKLNKLTVKLGPLQLRPAEKKEIEKKNREKD